MKKINEIRMRKKRKLIFRRIRACIVLLIFILALNKLSSNFFTSPSTSNLTRTLSVSNIDEDKISVILDPGHGGHDIGASFGSIYEKDIVLSISNKVGEILEENDINVIYTRSIDIALGDYEKEDLNSRVDISNSSEAEYFISFHINDYDMDSYGYEDISGFEVWTNYNDYSSLNLGRKIEENLESLNYTEKRPMLDGSEDLYIIRENNIPSVLIEFGFMNSYKDRLYLSNEYNQELLAEAVANAIMESIYENSKGAVSK